MRTSHPASSCSPRTLSAIGAPEQTYPLAGDPTGTPATYTWAYKQSKTQGLSVRIKAYGADLALESSSTVESSIELTFKLPADGTTSCTGRRRATRYSGLRSSRGPRLRSFGETVDGSAQQLRQRRRANRSQPPRDPLV